MKAELYRVNGSPEISFCGKKYSPISYRSFQPQPSTVKSFYDNGYELQHLFPSGMLCSLGTPYSNSGEVWVGENKYNWDNLRKHIDMFLKAAPNAKFSLLIHLDTRSWYLDENPEAYNSFKKLILMCKDEKWRKSASDFLRSIIEFVRREYPERVYIAHLFAGHTCEWNSCYPQEGIPENSSFASSYRQKFGESEKLPAEKELFNADNGVFRHPKKDRNAIEFWDFYSETIAETIEFFAKQVKEVSNGELLTGCFYGYTMAYRNPYICGYASFNTLLNSPYIDAVFSPSAYRPFRGMESSNGFNLPVDSLKLHKKLYIHEIDNTTSITTENKLANMVQHLHQRPETVEASLNYSLRDAARSLEHGGGYWWFDMWNGWFNHPVLMQGMKAMKRASEKIYKAGTEAVSEIAVFVDSKSALYLGDSLEYNTLKKVTEGKGGAAAYYDMIYKQQEELNKIGAPVTYYDADDLKHPDFPHGNIKLYIFLNLYAPAKDIKEAVINLRKQGKSVMYLYAPGYITEDDYSLESMKELTGFEFSYVNGEPCGKISLEKDEAVSWGGGRDIVPLFTVCEDNLEILCRYSKTKLPAGAVRKREGAVDVWVSCGPVPGRVLRSIAKKAGVFIYHDGDDPVYVNKGMFGMYSFKGGEKYINVPENTSLISLLEGERSCLAENGRIKLSFKPKEFKLFLRK